VDAADLHLILNPTIKHREHFSGGKIATIRNDDCTECRKCIEVCQFQATSDDFIIDPISCEGCGVCVLFCPEHVIDFKEHINGEWFISDTRFGPMVHAKLGVAEENSGKLVSLVRRQAKFLAEKERSDFIVVDGAPGVGCPVISSITGADAVLIVTEPTLSGVHDMERVIDLAANHFSIHTFVCINKYDINVEITAKIESLCREKNIAVAGKIPYDTVVTDAMVQMKNVFEYSKNGNVVAAIKSIWQSMMLNLS